MLICVLWDFRMYIPIRRWVFLWTGFSLSIPKGSWFRSTPKPISPRKTHFLFDLIFSNPCNLTQDTCEQTVRYVSPSQLRPSVRDGRPRLPAPSSRSRSRLLLLRHLRPVQLLERTSSQGHQPGGRGGRPTSTCDKLRKTPHQIQHLGRCIPAFLHIPVRHDTVPGGFGIHREASSPDLRVKVLIISESKNLGNSHQAFPQT